MNSKLRYTLVAGAVAVSGLLAQAVGPLAPVALADPPHRAVEIQTYGASYGEWGARWWEWALSIPVTNNPLLDETGANCGVGQYYGNVWFLAGTFGGPVVRNCTVPRGKALFFPLVNYVGWRTGSEPSLPTLLELRAETATEIDAVTDLFCTVDGKKCANDLFEFRAMSPFFALIAPATDGIVSPGDIAGPGNADNLAADGYWIMLPPPKPRGSPYVIRFGGTSASGGGFDVDVTYYITVN